jgi:homoserine kinase
MPPRTHGTIAFDVDAGDSILISVPASTSNLGPAMDGIGMSVPLRLEVAIDATGSQEHGLAGTDEVRALLGRLAPGGPAAHARVTANPIPVERGLGGSGTVRLAALLAATAWRGERPDEAWLLRTATSLEGHPDNVVPSLLGGVVATTIEDDGSVRWVELGALTGLDLVLVVPEVRISTERAREILPQQVPHADARFTAGHVALLVAAIATRRFDALDVATRDRIHQPFRVPLVPGADGALAAAVPAGALCSFLSGSGSTVAALARPGAGMAVAEAMTTPFRSADVPAAAHVLPMDERGAELAVIRDGVESAGWRWAQRPDGQRHP